MNTKRCLLGVMLLLCVRAAEAGSLTLAWDPNTESNLAGYVLLYGTQPGVYTTPIDVGNRTSFQVDNLTVGRRYYFSAQAYNTFGSRSPLAVEVSGVVPARLTVSLQGGGTVASTDAAIQCPPTCSLGYTA